MALTEVERRLLDGFIWHASVTHQAVHRNPAVAPNDGPPNFRDCPHKTCRYAAEIVAWAEQRDTMPPETKG